MKKYVLPIIVEANSKQEAEEKVVRLLKIAAEYKKVTLSDFVGGVVNICNEVASILKKSQLIQTPKADKRNGQYEGKGVSFSLASDNSTQK